MDVYIFTSPISILCLIIAFSTTDHEKDLNAVTTRHRQRCQQRKSRGGSLCTICSIKKSWSGIQKVLANLYFSFLGVGVFITRVIITFLIGELQIRHPCFRKDRKIICRHFVNTIHWHGTPHKFCKYQRYGCLYFYIANFNSLSHH